MRTYVIAEAGSCHDGELSQACHLVDAAWAAGANAIKFQFWSDPDKLASRRRVPEKYLDIYRRYKMPFDWLETLRSRASELGLEFMCTAYLPEDVQALAAYVAHFKVASFEAQATDLVAAHQVWMEGDIQQGRKRNLIVSLGMGARFTAAWRDSPHAAKLYQRTKLLHCVSAYPAPAEDLSLNAVRSLDGFSDHSDPALTWTGALAVACGATILEAHLRLEKIDRHNPDGPHAMLPEQFKDYVRHVRFAETCLGKTAPGAQPSEAEMSKYRVIIKP